MEIGEEIAHILDPEVVFVIRMFGLEIGVRDSVISMWILTVALVIVVKLLMKRFKDIPDKKQGMLEAFVEMIRNFVKGNTDGHHSDHIAPFIGTIIVYISLLNIGGVFNILPDPAQIYETTGWSFLRGAPHIRIFPPPKDINITLGLAVASVGMVLYKTLTVKKFKAGLRTFIEPVPLMLPFKLLDFVVRPLSLTLRMFGNVMAAYIMMELVYLAFPLIVPGVLGIYFDLFDGVLQAFIFTFLTTLYMAEALE